MDQKEQIDKILRSQYRTNWGKIPLLLTIILLAIFGPYFYYSGTNEIVEATTVSAAPESINSKTKKSMQVQLTNGEVLLAKLPVNLPVKLNAKVKINIRKTNLFGYREAAILHYIEEPTPLIRVVK
jgi:hypothetical protein